MTQRPPEVSASGAADQTPVGSGSVVHPAPPADSIEYARTVLSDLISAAFADARALDLRGRAIAGAFRALDHEDRIALSNKHPRLLEHLLLLEDLIDRIDRR